MDKLDKIYEKQFNLQSKLNVNVKQQSYKTIMTLALIDEAMESLRETPWKPWKSKQQLDKQKYKEELIDILHFFINLCISVDMKPIDIYKMYMDKNKINIKRQEQGY